MRFTQLASCWLSTLTVLGCSSEYSPKSSLPKNATANLAVKVTEPHQVLIGILEEMPQDYLDAHAVLFEPSRSDWDDAAAKLKLSGDEFTIHILHEVEPELNPYQEEVADDLIATIKRSHCEKVWFDHELVYRLELSAAADVSCHNIEHILPYWTMQALSQELDSVELRAQLLQIKQHYQSAANDDLLAQAMTSRVKQYARDLLAGK